MASEKQIAANRRNARNSTGPRTEKGKLRSRQNAFRHGLTAETVINIVENADEYTDLGALIIADYEPQTTVERLLVERLVSLLWRLRRAVKIETGIFQIQGEAIRDRRVSNQQSASKDALEMFRQILKQNKPEQLDHDAIDLKHTTTNGQTTSSSTRVSELSHCFLRLAHLDGHILERVERYEVSLWRQAAQTMLILNSFPRVPRIYGRTKWGNVSSRNWRG